MAKISMNGKTVFCLSADSKLISDMKWKSRRIDIPVSRLINKAIAEYLERNPRENEAREREAYQKKNKN